MLKALLFFFTGLMSAPCAHAAFYSLNVDGGYLYSRWEYQSPASTFSLLSRAGQSGRGMLTVGSKSWDFLGGGGVDNFKFQGPDTRTLVKDEISTSMYLVGVRYKTPYLFTNLTFQGKDALHLVEHSPTSFEIKKFGVGFGVFGVTLFGWGQGYRLTLDAEMGIPANKPKTDDGTMSPSYFTRGVTRVEFGGSFRVGIFAGIENMEYTVNTEATNAESKFYRSDFFGGLTIAIGAGKSGKSGGGGSSKGWSSGSVPNYPL